VPIEADTVHRNARIYTLDPARPWASVLVVRDGLVAAVGDEELLDRVDGACEVVDHQGAFLMPGLGDVHNHHMLAGRADLLELQLDGSADVEGLLTAIRSWSAELPPDAWVVGGGWGSVLIPVLSDATVLAALDEAAGGRPVCLRDDSCHNRWASSAALAAAGITAYSADPADGAVIREPGTRRPLGVLIEAALLPVERAYAAAAGTTIEQDAQACRRGIEILHSFGITAYQDAASSLPMLRALKHLDSTGALEAWAVTSMQLNDNIFGTYPLGHELLEHREATRSHRHRPTFVKIFLDGVPVPGSWSAAMLDPYLPHAEHGPDWRGTTTMTAEELTGWLIGVAEQGLGAKVHCVGDASVRMTLDAIAAVRAAGHTATILHIAHGQYVNPADVPRFAELGVVADISPALWFPTVIFDAICACVPRDRAKHLHPNRDLVDLGVLIAGGSDWPVMPSPNPWYGIQGLVTRADPTGERPGQLWPEQALTVNEALHAYSRGVADAMGVGDVTGSLEPGKSADFVVLDRNPLDVPVTELYLTTAMSTWFAGRRVYSRPDLERKTDV
jgi:predicted amidohydrolase YtcJ